MGRKAPTKADVAAQSKRSERRLKLAAATLLDTSTVDRFMAGEPVRNATRHALVAACKRLGYEYPRATKA